MKFKDYLLLETPLLVDLENGSEYVIKIFNALKNKKILKEELFGDYKLIYYPPSLANNIQIILFDKNKLDVPLLYISQSAETILSKKLIKNAYINKVKSLDSNVVHDVLFHLLKNCDGIISDDTQSEGGKNLWKALLEKAENKNYKIGVYDSISNKINLKDKDLSFKLWYTLKSREVYSETNLRSLSYQMIILK
jgi:hypothetical protein